METPWKHSIHAYAEKGSWEKGGKKKEQKKNKRPCTSWRRTRFLRKHSVHMHIPQKEGSAKIGSICETVRESENEMYLCVVSSKENDGTN